MEQEYIDRLRFLEDKWELEHMKDPWYKEPVPEPEPVPELVPEPVEQVED